MQIDGEEHLDGFSGRRHYLVGKNVPLIAVGDIRRSTQLGLVRLQRMKFSFHDIFNVNNHGTIAGEATDGFDD